MRGIESMTINNPSEKPLGQETGQPLEDEQALNGEIERPGVNEKPDYPTESFMASFRKKLEKEYKGLSLALALYLAAGAADLLKSSYEDGLFSKETSRQARQEGPRGFAAWEAELLEAAKGFIEKFGKDLERLEQAGYKVEIKRDFIYLDGEAMVAYNRREVIKDFFGSKLVLDKNMNGQEETTQFSDQPEYAARINPRLNLNGGQVYAYPFHLHRQQVSDTSCYLVLFDYSSPDKPVVFQTTAEAGSAEELLDAERSAIESMMQAVGERCHQSEQASAKAKTSPRHGYLYDFAPDLEIPAADRKAIDEFLKKANQVSIGALGRNQAFEETRLSETDMDIGKETFKDIGYHPLLINGQLRSLSFVCFLSDEKIRGLGAKQDGGKYSFKDSFGNEIIIRKKSSLGESKEAGIASAVGGMKAVKTIAGTEWAVLVSFPLALEDPEQAEKKGLDGRRSVDLTRLGLGKLERAIYSDVFFPIREVKEGEYQIYSNIERESRSKSHYESDGLDEFMGKFFQKRLKDFEEGIAKMEDHFGFERQGQVKKVCVFDSVSANSGVTIANHDAVIIYANLLKKKNEKIKLDIIAGHEVVHTFDDQYRLSEGLDFSDILCSTEVGFFEQLNEKSFFKDGFGGHSRDDRKEFLATLIVSTLRPDWPAKMAAQNLRFMEVYRINLKKVLTAIVSCQHIPRNAPVIMNLDRRIKLLDELIEKRVADNGHSLK